MARTFTFLIAGTERLKIIMIGKGKYSWISPLGDAEATKQEKEWIMRVGEVEYTRTSLKECIAYSFGVKGFEVKNVPI